MLGSIGFVSHAARDRFAGNISHRCVFKQSGFNEPEKQDFGSAGGRPSPPIPSSRFALRLCDAAAEAYATVFHPNMSRVPFHTR